MSAPRRAEAPPGARPTSAGPTDLERRIGATFARLVRSAAGRTCGDCAHAVIPGGEGYCGLHYDATTGQALDVGRYAIACRDFVAESR